MRRLLFLMLFIFIGLYGSEVKEINEYKVDLYYANGIMMVDDEDQAKSDWRERVDDLLSSHPKIQPYIGKIDVAYNISGTLAKKEWQSFIQKTELEHSYKVGWSAFQYFIGKIPYVKITKWIMKANELATKINKEITLEKQIKQYEQSINEGHGVVVVAHSQGNLFAMQAFKRLDWWRKPYFHTIAVASPTSKIPHNGHAVTFDNDIITVIPNAHKSTIKNPNRRDITYFRRNALNEIIGSRTLARDVKSVQYHRFEYYLGYPTYETILKSGTTGEDAIVGAVKMQTDIAKNKIEKYLLEEIDNHFKRDSQYKFKEYGCSCKENYIKLTHINYNSDPLSAESDANLTRELDKYKVLNFAGKDENAKIYKIDDIYVRALKGGFIIEDVNDSKSCMALLDKNGKQIGSIKKAEYRYKPKKGLIEVDLNWTNPENDLDLDVEMLRGVHDVKDIPCPYEHFAGVPLCKDKRYLIFVDRDDFKKYEYPFSYTLTIKTADGRGGYNKMVVPVTINNGHDFIKYRHVADIVVRCNRGSKSGASKDGGGGITITPVTPPECPPIPNIKLPTRKPKPIYTYGGGGYFGGGGTWYGGSGGGSGGGTSNYSAYSGYSGQGAPSSVHMSIQQIPQCGGSIDCLQKVGDDSGAGSSSGGGSQEYASPTLEYGGVPSTPIVSKPIVVDSNNSIPTKEEKCKSKDKYSCGCMPCKYSAVKYSKSVQLGPISGAAYSIYSVDGYREDLPIYSGKTTKGKDLYDSGIVDLPIDVLNSLEDEKLYILKVKGGEDIDANDDFKLDTKPTINRGEIYAMAKGKDIKGLGFKANILTTMAFKLSKELIDDGESAKKIESRLNLIATRVLRDKIYGDKSEVGITNRDLILWLPTIDKDMLLKSYKPLEKMVQKIYKDEDIYDDAYSYVFDKNLDANATIKPVIKTFVGEISEDAKSGDVVGKIEVLRGKDIEFSNLRGVDAKDFKISKDGVISVDSNATIDYEHRWRYDLVVEAHNKAGSSGDVRVFIKVKNVPDAPEFVKYIGGSVDENATGGTKIGQVVFNPAGAEISKIELSGSSKDLFKIDLDGNIYLKEGAKLDFEKKMYYGFWVFAYNKYGRSLPAAVYIIVKNVPDTPEITDYKGGSISEDASGGTVIGKLLFKKGGSDISRAYLSDFNDTFSIDKQGVISLKSGAKLDYEKIAFYKMDAVIENSFGKSSYPVFVRVVDVLDVPQFVSFEGGNVDEYADIGTVVGELKFNEGKAPISKIALSGRDASYFSIDSSGVLHLAKRVDYEDKSELLVTVNAYNKLGKSRDVKLHIFVNDEVEREPSLANSSFTVLENASVGKLIGDITVLSKGASDIESFKLVGDSNDSFRVDKDGKVYLAKELDYSKRAKYRFDVYAINKYGSSKGAKLAISVIRHTVPILDDTTLSVSESAKVGDVVGKVKVVSEGGSKIDSFKIVEHLLKLDLSKIPFKIDNSGVIRVSKKLDYESKREYSFEVNATNSYGSRGAIVTVKVLNAADALPEVLFKVAKVAENKPKGSVVGKIEARSDSKIEKYEISDTVDFVVDSNGTIKTNRVFDYEKKREFKFKVRVKNSSGYSKWGDYVVKIVNGNDTVPVLENSTYKIKESANIGSIVGKVKVLSLGGGKIEGYKIVNSGLPFKIDNSGAITLTKKLDYESKKEYYFEVNATNSYGDGSAIVTVKVEDVPDSLPTVYQDLFAYIEENKPKGSVVGKLEVNSDSKIEQYEINSTADFVIDENGTIKSNRVFDYEKEKKIKFKVRVKNKTGFSKWSDYFVNIINIADALPKIVSSKGEIKEGEAKGSSVGKIEVQSDSPIKEYDINGTADFMIDENGTIRSNRVFDYEKEKSFKFKVRVKNKSGFSKWSDYVVDIIDIDDSVPILEDTTLSIKESVKVGDIVGKIKVDNSSDNGIKGYKVVAWKDAKKQQELWPKGYFKVDNSGEVIVDSNASLDFEKQKVYETYVVAVNKNGESNKTRLKINITDVADLLPVCSDKNITLYNVSKNLNVGTVIKPYIDCNGEDSVIKSVKLEPKSPFRAMLDKGNISLVVKDMFSDSNESRYDLVLNVANEAGAIKVPVIINVVDGNYTFDMYEGALGHKLGRINLGSKEVSYVNLDDSDDSYYFDIDKNGTLKRSSEANGYGAKQYSFKVNINYKDGSTKELPVVVNSKSRTIYKTNFMQHINRMIFDENSSIAYLGGDKLVIADLNNTQKPKVLVDISTNNILDMAISKDKKYLYTLEQDNSFKIIDIEDLSNIKTVSQLEVSGTKIAESNDKVAILDSKIKLIDISDKSTPKLVQEIGFLGKIEKDEYGDSIKPSGYQDIKMLDNVVYSTLWSYGLQAIDVKDLNNPQLIYNEGIDKKGYVFTTGLNLNKKQKVIITATTNDTPVSIYKIIGNSVKKIYRDQTELLNNNSVSLLNGSLLFLSNSIYDLYNISNIKNIYYNDSIGFGSGAVIGNKGLFVYPSGGALQFFTLQDLEGLEHLNSNIKVPPAIDKSLDITIDENVTKGSKVAKLNVLSSSDEIDSFSCKGYGCENFTINKNGEIFISDKADIDYEMQKKYVFAVNANTKRGSSNYATVTVNVNNIDDIPPSIKGFWASIDENNKVPTRIGQVSVSYSGDSPISAFEITNSNDFGIDSNGTIFANVALDYEKNRTYDLKVRAKNRAGWSKFADVYVKVNDLNDTVPILADVAVSIKENAKTHQKIGKIDVLTIGGAKIDKFGFENSKNLPFGIDSSWNIEVLGELNYNTKKSYDLKAFAQNIYGKGFANVRIDILEWKKPKLLSTKFNVPETIKSGAKIGRVQVETSGDENISSFNIYGDEASKFRIDKEGVLYLKDNEKLDYESKSRYKFKATATSLAGVSKPVDVDISVLDEGEAPTITPANFVVSKIMPRKIGDLVGYLKILNNDGDITSVELSGDGANDFSIDKSGKITFANSIQGAKEYHLKVVAVNKFGKSNVADVNISVESLAKISAGVDMTVTEFDDIEFRGKADNTRDIESVIWSSSDSGAIYCNGLECELQNNNMSPGVYSVTMRVKYSSGLVLEDSLNLTVEKDKFDNTISTLDGEIDGVEDIKISKDKKYIYATGNFTDDSSFKVINIYNPKNMYVVDSYYDNIEEYEKELIINDDGNKAIMLTVRGAEESKISSIVILDISDYNNIKEIKRIETVDSICMLRWYKNNQFVFYDKTDKNVYLADINNLQKRKIYHNDVELNNLLIAKKRGILIAQTENIELASLANINTSEGDEIYFINIGNSNKLGHSLCNGCENLYVDEINNIFYQDNWNGTYNTLDISKNFIDKKEVEWVKFLNNRVIINNNKDSFYTFSGGNFNSYSFLSELKLGSKEYLTNIALFKGSIYKVFVNENKSVAYVLSNRGLCSVKIDRNNGDKVLDYLNTDYLNWFKDNTYAYSLDILGRLNLFKDTNNKLELKAKVEVRLPCYPNCQYGWEYYPLYSADVLDNLVFDTISYEDNSSENMKIDISNKEQDVVVQLDKNVTYGYSYFKLIENKKYIVGIKNLYSKDIILDFKNNNNVLSQIQINLDKEIGYIISLNIVEVKGKDKLIVLINNKLYLISIADIEHPKILNIFSGKDYLKTFVFDQQRSRIYLLNEYGKTLYLIEGIDKNVFNIVKKYKVDNRYKTIESMVLSPSSNRLALLYSNGKIEIFNSEFQKEKISFLPDNDNHEGLSFKNDNILFINGYIVKLNK